MKNVILFIFLSGGAWAAANEASFDCKKASSVIEKKICGDEHLSQLDRLLGTVYSSQTKSLAKPEKEKMKKAQSAWLKERDDCLGRLPEERDECLEEGYDKRIRDLGGTEDLVLLYRAVCQKNDADCLHIGDLDIDLEHWDDAVKDLAKSCDADHDGDLGESCYMKAMALEKLNKKTEAIEQFTKTCKDRQHNEACAAAYRLGGKKSANDWVGLYRNETGTIFISEWPDGKISLNAETHWANGHLCIWNKTGKAQEGKLTVETDPEAPECAPVIERKETKLKVQDPNLACKYAYCATRALFSGDFQLDSKSGP